MIPDIKTLVLLYLITNVINAGAIAVIWIRNRRRFAGISLWLVMMVLQVAASLLHMLRGQVPDLISMTIANALGLAGLVILLMGLERFTEKKGRQLHNYALLGVFIAINAYFVVIQPNLPARDITLSAMIMIYTFQCSWLLLHRVEPSMRKITRLTGTVLAVNAAFNFVRIILNLSFPEQSSDFYKSGAVNALAITGYIVLNMCLAISLILMVSRRLVENIGTQEEKFSKAFHSSPYAITITKSSDGAILEVNDGFLNITGYQYDEIIGKTTLDLRLWIREEDRLAVGNELRQGHGVHEVEYQFRHKTGKVMTGLFSANLVMIDNETCLLSSINDITERKQMEEAQTFLLQCGLPGTGEDFFESLARYLAKTTGMGYVCIDRLEGDGLTAQTVAVYNAGNLENNVSYTLKDTPCGEVVGKGVCCYPRGVRQLFPRDEALQELKAESYFGTTLVDSKGRQIGLIAVIGHQALDDPKSVESLLKFVAPRAAGELERRRAEDALRQSERKYRLLADHMKDAIWLMDMNLKAIYVSPSIEKRRGYTFEEIAQLSPEKNYTPASFQRAMDYFSQEMPKAIADPTYYSEHQIELEYVCKDGSTYWSENMFSIIRDENGKPISILGEGRDITERKLAEDKLRDSETRFRQLANSTWEGIFIHRDGIILDVNEALSDMFGYDKTEIIGKNVLDFIANEFTEKVMQMLKEGTQSSVLQVEGKGRKKDGTVFPIETLGRPISYNNLPARVIAIRDLTQQKQSEEVREKLEAQNRQLQKSESLGRMAAAIAHHFNNQLAAVIGNLELAMDKMPQNEEPFDTLNSALQSAWKAAQISGMMLTYVGQKSGQREPLDISETCLRSLPILKAAMPGNVIMETDIPSPGPVISANANQIQQVLTNLVTNAWESVGDNKGTIYQTVKTVNPEEISSFHRYPGDWQPKDKVYACLEVTDTCCGIEDKDIEKLFDPFYSTKFTGRGMGLAVVLGIVNAHGGVITVDSKPGMGSAFRVFLPVSSEKLTKQTEKAPPPMAIEEGGTVLLIEDEEPLRNMAATMLKRLGFTVLEANDGVEAVELFRQRQNEIRFVLSDLTMPRIDGWEALTALRKLQPGVPVILASGYDKAHVMAGDHPELPQVFLGKPYRLKELSDAISQALHL